jgi:hypothetical protein
MAAKAGTQGQRRAVTLDPRFRGGDGEWESSVCFAVLCAAQHDEGVYRLHSLT